MGQQGRVHRWGTWLYVVVMEDGMFQPLGVMTMGDMMDWADSQEALTGAGEFLFRYMELMPAGGH